PPSTRPRPRSPLSKAEHASRRPSTPLAAARPRRTLRVRRRPAALRATPNGSATCALHLLSGLLAVHRQRQLAAPKAVGDLLGGRSLTEAVALGEAEADAPEQLHLSGCLGPLGHRRHPQRIGQLLDRGQQSGVTGV